MKLRSVKIRKFKCFSGEEGFDAEPNVTVFVGKNESGKTALLQALGKSNYFTDDADFKFDATLDYPRSEKKAYDRSGQVATPIDCTFTIEPELIAEIAKDVGSGVFSSETVGVSRKYDNSWTFDGVTADKDAFASWVCSKLGTTDAGVVARIKSLTDARSLQQFIAETSDDERKKAMSFLSRYYENKWQWPCPISEYIARVRLQPRLPAFIYYSEYYELPSRIDLSEFQAGRGDNPEAIKTAKALFELADINVGEILSATNFEKYIAELEATANEVTNQLFRFWTTNKELRIRFQIDKQTRQHPHGHPIVYPILDIRVEDLKHSVSLPLRSRSKGFNWFFSFVVWFSKIQEKHDRPYILLLDEPGLNLHASAQADLLRFIEELSKKYQILFTTHSPFMIETEHLHRVRTVVDRDGKTEISDGIQERDPDTIFPLQAALGYDIAQNLFIGKANLLVEGASDLLYVSLMSSVLEKAGRVHLDDSVVIVPVGGADKVATFISLLKGSKLKLACLLDSMTDPAAKQRLEDMVRKKIIKESAIRYCDEYVTPRRPADVEDLFTKEDYLKVFFAAHPEHQKVAVSGLDASIPQITQQITRAIGCERYNHYRPANKLATLGVGPDFFQKATLDTWEAVFKDINKRLA